MTRLRFSRPTEAAIEKMLADGYFGELVSILCLGAAVAVKRGESPPTIQALNDEPLSPEQQADLRHAMERTHKMLLTATPDELDAAIALYTEHLTRAGYRFEGGYVH